MDQMDCGPACLSMIADYYGKNYSIQYLREYSFLSRDGVSLLGIGEAARTIGLDDFPTKVTIKQLNQCPLPCILHWNQNHFVVLSEIRLNRITGRKKYIIADPAHGVVSLTTDKFRSMWLSASDHGIALFFKTTETFFEKEGEPIKKFSLRYFFNYLAPFKKQLLSLFLCLLFSSLINLLFPFLMKNMIDQGVEEKNIALVRNILLAQLSLFVGLTFFEVVRNWIMLIVGTKVSTTIISDYIRKILRLSMKFFDSKMMGDFNQRIRDNERIELFLTSQSLVTFFSVLTFSVYFYVLWRYDVHLLLIYISLTIISISWSILWLKKRAMLDYNRFLERAENQNAIYEIISGVTEMKLNQFEDYKRKSWENIQTKLFSLNIRILKLDQLSRSGFDFINQFKNIAVTYLAAVFVIQGKLSLGELLSLSFIIGQMNAPISQLIQFARSFQDAKLSAERLNEVESYQQEEVEGMKKVVDTDGKRHLKIVVDKLDFQYEGPQSPFVLKDVNIEIQAGKVTAVVGTSGSGKTTLLKILLNFYNVKSGTVYYGFNDLNDLSPGDLRKNCGVVMQDGYIFSETIERNIVMGDEIRDDDRYRNAVDVANIGDFIESLPLKEKTMIGASGNGISGGQKQRLLIARAVYKNPQFLFFDEATSALDAENEKVIHDKLQSFFKGKTVVIVAHRLSTVKHADQIVVLKQGKVVEQGTHKELVANKCDYYNLVKNQLELGN